MDLLERFIPIIVFFILFAAFVLDFVVLQPKRDYRKTAFSLTKQIGEKIIQCVSIKTERGRAFYLMEEEADVNSTKFLKKIEEGWLDSSHSVKIAKKITESIIKLMPYDLRIIELDVSETDFLRPRLRDIDLRELKNDIKHDEDDITDLILFLKMDNKRFWIVRYNCEELSKSLLEKWFRYLLVINEKGKDNRYVFLFDYPEGKIEIANDRVSHYVQFFNSTLKDLSQQGRGVEKITVLDQEYSSFLENENPFMGSISEIIYRGLDSFTRIRNSEPNKTSH